MPLITLQKRTHYNIPLIHTMRMLGQWVNPSYLAADYPVYTLTVAASTANYNVRALLNAIGGFNNADPFFLVKVHLNSNVIISSADPNTAAFDSGSVNANAIIEITGDSGSQIVGAGGTPGAGGNTSSKPGFAGSRGGTAIKSTCAIYIDLKNLQVHSGGGGGGGGALLDTGTPAPPSPPTPPPTPPPGPTPPPPAPPPEPPPLVLDTGEGAGADDGDGGSF